MIDNDGILLEGYKYRGKNYVEDKLFIKKSQACMYSGLKEEEFRNFIDNERIFDRKTRFRNYYIQRMLESLHMLNYNFFISSGEICGDRDFFDIVEDLKYVGRNRKIKNILVVPNREELEKMENFDDLITSADLLIFSDDKNKKGIDSNYFNDFLMMVHSSYLISCSSYNIQSISGSTYFNAGKLKLNGMNIDPIMENNFMY